MRLILLALVGALAWASQACADPDNPAEFLVACAGERCDQDRQAFYDSYLLALAGDSAAQRRVAEALERGEPPVRQDALASCAWRAVIIAFNTPPVSEAERGTFGAYCRSLGAGQQADVARYSQWLGMKVYLSDPVRWANTLAARP